jgi:cytochrome o ubiquinol oxidase subunit IV
MTDEEQYRSERREYVAGLAAALALTAAAFASVAFGGWPLTTTLAVIFVLALVQVIIHLRFFLHIDLRRSQREDLQLILFSTMIVAIMVSGTLVILFNLKSRMM